VSPRARREPAPPPATHGVEIRHRTPRNGLPYWQFRVRWNNPATNVREVEIFDEAQVTLDPAATIAEREAAWAADLQDALDFRAHLRLLKRRGTVKDLDKGREILKDFAQRWMHDWARLNLTHGALKNYSSIYNNHLLPRVGHLQLRQITPKVVDQLKNDLIAAGVGRPTIIRAMTVLQSICRQAIVWGEMDVNPVREVRKPAQRRKKVITPLTVLQVELVLAFLDLAGAARHRMLCELMAYAMGRPQDVLGLSWESVGTQRLVYAYKNVEGEIMEGAKTGEGKSRSVALWPVVRADLIVYRTAQAGTGINNLVVPREDGAAWRAHDYGNFTARKPRSRRRASDGQRGGSPGLFAQAATAAGVPDATLYWLRHTSVSLRIAEQTMSLAEIAAEAGHTVEELAETYAHVISEYRGQGPINPDQLIRQAREQIVSEVASARDYGVTEIASLISGARARIAGAGITFGGEIEGGAQS
jgi:integrase